MQLLIVARDNDNTPSDVKEAVEKSIVSQTASSKNFVLFCFVLFFVLVLVDTFKVLNYVNYHEMWDLYGHLACLSSFCTCSYYGGKDSVHSLDTFPPPHPFRRSCVAQNSMLQCLVQEDLRTQEATLESLVDCYR